MLPIGLTGNLATGILRGHFRETSVLRERTATTYDIVRGEIGRETTPRVREPEDGEDILSHKRYGSIHVASVGTHEGIALRDEPIGILEVEGVHEARHEGWESLHENAVNSLRVSPAHEYEPYSFRHLVAHAFEHGLPILEMPQRRRGSDIEPYVIAVPWQQITAFAEHIRPRLSLCEVRRHTADRLDTHVYVVAVEVDIPVEVCCPDIASSGDKPEKQHPPARMHGEDVRIAAPADTPGEREPPVRRSHHGAHVRTPPEYRLAPVSRDHVHVTSARTTQSLYGRESEYSISEAPGIARAPSVTARVDARLYEERASLRMLGERVAGVERTREYEHATARAVGRGPAHGGYEPLLADRRHERSEFLTRLPHTHPCIRNR